MLKSRLTGRYATLRGWVFALACLSMGMAAGLHAEEGEAPADAPAAVDTAEPTTLRVILVRHAEAFRNLPNRGEFSKDKWDTLTPKGEQQAQAVGRALKTQGVQVEKVYTAPTGRARQTAAELMKVLGLKGEAQDDAAINMCQMGESGADKTARVCGAIAKAMKAYPGKTVVLVTHQHLIISALQRAAGMDKKQNKKVEFSAPPGSMAEIQIAKDTWTIVKEPQVMLAKEAAAKPEAAQSEK